MSSYAEERRLWIYKRKQKQWNPTRERCEWDPKRNLPNISDLGCSNEATVSVGAKGEWHLCDSCVKLPAFKRFRRIRKLKRDVNV